MVPWIWVLSIGIRNFKYVGDILSEIFWFKKYGKKKVFIYSLGKL